MGEAGGDGGVWGGDPVAASRMWFCYAICVLGYEGGSLS